MITNGEPTPTAKGTRMDLDRISKIVDHLSGSAARDIRIRTEEMDLRISFAPRSSEASSQTAQAPSGQTVEAALPGLVYLSPSPGAAPFVSLGDRVQTGQTLMLIEAMKSMLTVTAPTDAIVAEICVTDESQVDAGDVLLRLKEDAA